MKYVLSLALAMLISFGFAQNADTVKANKIYKQAYALAMSGKYKESADALKQALVIYRDAADWAKVADCHNEIAKNYIQTSQLKDAAQESEIALSIALEKLGDNTAAVATAYASMGFIQRLQGMDDEALANAERALAIRKKIFPESSTAVTEVYSMIGHLHYRKGDYDTALDYYNKSVALTIKAYGEDYLLLGRDYNEIGVIYADRGEPELAIRYYEKVLAIATKHLGSKHPYIASTLSNISSAERRKGDLKAAMGHQKQALQIRLTTFGKKDISTSNSYSGLGLLYLNMKEYDSALLNLKTALAIRRELMAPNSHPIATVLKNIGETYLAMGQLDSATAYLQVAAPFYTTALGPNNPSISSLYNFSGQLNLKKHNYPQALKDFQASLIANVLSFENTAIATNPRLDNYLDANVLLQTLSYKATALIRKYDHQKKTEDLLIALGVYHTADTLIGQIRSSLRVQADKIEAAKLATTVYDGAIQTCMRLYQATKKEHYKSLMFYFSEKSKAGSLRETISTIAAKNFVQLPVAITRLERSLNADIAYYQSKVQQEKNGRKDSLTLHGLNTKIFTLNRSRDSLIVVLEKNYPKYHQLKYQDRIMKLDELQSRLPVSTAVIEYFQGDSSLYVFTVTAHTFQYFVVENDVAFSDAIKNFRTSLDPKKQATSQLAARTQRTLYAQEAYAVFGRFLAPALRPLDGQTKLIIIPDGQLCYLPFDVLLTKPAVEGKFDYASLPYLLKDFTISYSYAATLLFDHDSRRRYAGPDYIAFAPSYGTDSYKQGDAVALGRFRDQVTPLTWTKQEITNIGKYLDGKPFSGEEAAEGNFKADAAQHAIIHLAMHALIDDEHPMMSRLVFSNKPDSVEDGFLNAFELYGMEIPSDMVVLSACETGYGKLERGEGIMSLGRAFAYAGTPSVVMSHWLVDDEATAQLMDHFYKNLAEGMSKDEALRQAKLEYLQAAHPIKQSPAFWASFVVFGNTEPIVGNSIFVYPAIGIAALLLMVIALIFHRKKGKMRNT